LLLASLGHQVTSLDVSEVGLVKAQNLALKRGVEIETCLADLADYDLRVPLIIPSRANRLQSRQSFNLYTHEDNLFMFSRQ